MIYVWNIDWINIYVEFSCRKKASNHIGKVYFDKNIRKIKAGLLSKYDFHIVHKTSDDNENSKRNPPPRQKKKEKKTKHCYFYKLI